VIGYWRVLRRFNRDTRLYLMAPTFIGVSYYGMFVVLFNLYLLRLGYDTRFIGGLNAVGQVAFIALSLPASRLGRRWGSRQPIVLALALYLVGFGLLPLAEFVPDGLRSAWLVVTFLIAFLGGPLYWVNSNVYLMGVTDPSVRDHAFSMRTALLPLAGFAGSLLGGWMPGALADLRGLDAAVVGPYRDALLLAGLLYLPALVAMVRAGEAAPDVAPEERPDAAPPPSQDADEEPVVVAVGAESVQPDSAHPGGRRIFRRVMLPLVIVDALRISAFIGTLGFINVYLDVDLGAATGQIGLIIGTALLLSGGAALLTPVITRLIGHRATIATTMVGMALFAVLLAVVPTLWAAAIAYALFMALSGISESSLAVFRMERVGVGLWGLMAGAAVTGQGIGEAGIYFGGGFLIEGVGFATFFLLVAAIALAGALVLWFTVPGRRHAPNVALHPTVSHPPDRVASGAPASDDPASDHSASDDPDIDQEVRP
jgi:MFS family permease